MPDSPKTLKLSLLFIAATLLLISSCSKNDNNNTVAQKNMLNVAYGTDAQQKMDIYLPANRTATNTKVLILIHGGGWTSGDKTDFSSALIDTLNKRFPNYAIFNINYRLGALPANNPFPTQELDIKTSVDFIYNNRADYLISDKYVLMGASAGGHLSLLHAYKYTNPVKIKAVVDFFGPTDMPDLYNNPGAYPIALLELLLNGTPITNAALYSSSSPLTYVSATSSPTIILQGSLDPLVNANTQSLPLKNKLTTMGVANQYVLYNGLHHGDDWSPVTYTDAFNKIQAFLTANVQ